MRAFAVVTLTAATLAALVTAAPAAELGLPNGGCARGQVWDGYQCQWARPPVADARPLYRAPQAYVEDDDEDDYVAEAPPVYTAPAYAYAVPYYRPPAVSYYAYARPRYDWRWRGGHPRHRRY